VAEWHRIPIQCLGARVHHLMRLSVLCKLQASSILNSIPATLPRHHALCSLISAFADDNRLIREGTAPQSTTSLVRSVDAILVKAQAASNCNSMLSVRCKHVTKCGTAPQSMHACTGGFFSIDNSFLKPLRQRT